MEKLMVKLAELIQRKDRFTYDMRSNCQVYTGIVCAYKATQQSDHFIDLPSVINHALEHDGIIGAWKDPDTGIVQYDSCRLFSDSDTAQRFAREQGQKAIYNLNREVTVDVLG